jgi:hypothetical protein
MQHTLYIRTLKKAEHTVFCVSDGQKTYYDPQFNRLIPYSSGQQVKRSVMDALAGELEEMPSPTTFLFDVTKKGEITEGEVFATCDPTHFDQLVGGWMKAAKGGKEKTIKRRSPFSFSAMRALHPLLAGVDRENITFDRSDRPDTRVIVRGPDGKEMTPEDVVTLLAEKDRSLMRKWIPDNKRATGLFVQDTAVDLRRLFCVSLSRFEPEITQETEDKLRQAGWVQGKNVFGDCLIAPVEIRDHLMYAIANALLNWRITSNQSRTFSLMETLAVAVSTNANQIAGSIRGRLSEENDNRAVPVIEEDLEGVDTYVTLSAGGYVPTRSEKKDALESARKKLIYWINAFDHENQIQA